MHIKDAYRDVFSSGTFAKASGFTLLELVITLVVLSVLVTAAAPSFSQIIESNKMKRLATELEWLMVQAKSEAVMRNEDIIIKLPNAIYSNPVINDWEISAELTNNKKIFLLNGDNFKNISLYHNFGRAEKKFNPFNGKFNGSGRFTFYINEMKKLSVVITGSLTNRIYICNYNDGDYGYERCPS